MTQPSGRTTEQPSGNAGSRPARGARDLSRQAIGGLLWLTVGGAGQAVLQLTVMVVLARLLSPHVFGQSAAGMMVVNLLMTFTTLGIGPALVQRETLDDADIHTGFTLSFATSLALTALVALLAPLIAGFFRDPTLTAPIRALSLMFVLRGQGVVAEFLLRRDLRFRELSIITATSYIIGFGIVGIGMALAGYGIWSLVVAQLAQMGIRTLAMSVRRPHGRRLALRPESLRSLGSFGAGHSLAKVVADLGNQADYVVVGRVLGVDALGVYERAFQLMSNGGKLFGESLNIVLFPTMARVQNERERLGRAYVRATTTVTLVVGPVAVGAALLSPEIVRVVLGQRWSSAIVPFQILALAILFRATASIGDALAAAIGAVYRRLLRRCIISSAIFAFCWIGSRWGLPGVAAGDLAALLLDFLIMAQMSLKATSVSWTDFVREQRPAIVLSVYTAVVASLAANGARMLHLPDVLTLAGAFTAVLITAVPLCIFLPRVFLGHHGEWMKSLLKEHLSRRKRRPAGDGAVPAAGAAS